jgi:hypothetical protein
VPSLGEAVAAVPTAPPVSGIVSLVFEGVLAFAARGFWLSLAGMVKNLDV